MIFIVDDFLKKPYKVRQYALENSNNFKKIENQIPGLRYDLEDDSFYLIKIIEEYSSKLIGKNLKIKTCGFQTIDKKYCFGAAHYDIDTDYASVLYLSPNPTRNSGTKIYGKKEKYNLNSSFMKIKHKNLIDFYSSNKNFFDRLKYKKSIKQFNSSYGDGMEVQNIFNRFVFYDANYIHHPMNFFGNNFSTSRLTFFSFLRVVPE